MTEFVIKHCSIYFKGRNPKGSIFFGFVLLIRACGREMRRGSVSANFGVWFQVLEGGKRYGLICFRKKDGIGRETFRLSAQKSQPSVHAAQNVLPELFELRREEAVQR
jgi:hypothetical protein